MSTTPRDSNQGGAGGPNGIGEPPPAAAADGPLAGEQGVQPLAATFRRILQVVFLIFVFAVVQMFMLWRVCDSGMKTAAALQHQGLPVLDDLAHLQENIAICRLGAYEYLFARENEKAGRAETMDAVAAQARSELEDIKKLLPEGDGKRLAFELEAAMNDLDAEFRTVRKLVDSDFAAGMKAMDDDIPPKKDRVNAAAEALKKSVSDFSGGQADATFGSFRAIQLNAILFGAGNILVAFGAVMFVLLAARRSRAQLTDTLERLDQRTQELAGSLSLVHATLDATADGIVMIDTSGGIGNFNQQLAAMWRVSEPGQTLKNKQRFLAYALPMVEGSAKFAGRMDELAAHPEHESFDVLELKDSRVFECCSKPQRIHDRICGRVWSFRDITERRRAEESLVAEQRLLNNLITALPDTIYFKDLESRFIRINNGFIRKHGLSDPAAALGKTDFELFGSEHAGEALADEQRIIKSGEPIINKEEREDWKDGRVTWVSTTKMPLRDGDGAIIGIMGVSRDITERKRAEESLRLLGSAVEQAEDSIHITDAQLELPGPKLLFVNPAFTKMTGYTAQEVLGKTPRILQGERTDKAVLARLRAALSRGEPFHGELVNYRKDGSQFQTEIHIAPIRDARGAITHFVAIKRDITERRRFEERLFQSQKMETVGKLAGGIAHEFNSIMTAILGQSELMLYDLPEGNPLRKNAVEVHRAADRAAILTRQLLAYGRKQILKPDVLDLNTVLAGMENTLRHLAGRDVDVHIAPPAGPKLVKADAGQIEQVIVNIVMNAADAMPHGGKLTLEIADTFLDPEYVSRCHELKAGDYVMLAITDTGAGMSDAVKARIFEPFFTTKEVGKGTGLGLATCQGIVKQSEGHINIYSEPGRGATFKIYLPKVQLEAKPPGPPLKTPGLARGTETILLVEDDPALREMAATLLGRLGYTVLTAANGLEALNVTHQRATGHIDLLFTDVVMPHMSGKELADRVKALYPRTKILFTSAYTENAFVHQGVLNPGIILLQKPFTPSSLAGKVREVLDNGTPAAAL
jgi:PAS domain S-box-containing protein